LGDTFTGPLTALLAMPKAQPPPSLSKTPATAFNRVLPSKIASESLIALISFSLPPAQAYRLRQSGATQSSFDCPVLPSRQPRCSPRGKVDAIAQSLPGTVEICRSAKIVLDTMPGTVQS